MRNQFSNKLAVYDKLPTGLSFPTFVLERRNCNLNGRRVTHLISWHLLILFFIPLFLNACSCGGGGTAVLPTQTLNIYAGETPTNRVSVEAEIAQTEAERSQGLMFRTSLGALNAMWFVFPSDTDGAFWMHNTSIPLDILFVNSSLRVVHIAQNTTPFSEDLISSPTAYRYALEVNAGFVTTHGIMIGDRIGSSD